LSFVVKLNFYGPVSRQGIISKVIANTFNDQALTIQQQKITIDGTGNTANSILSGNVSYIDSFEDF
jgi:hypothetical protein